MASGWGEEYGTIKDKGEIGFIDYGDDKSVCSYNPEEEGPVVVSVPFPFVSGKPQSIFIGEVAFDSVTIKNTTDEPVELWSVRIYASNPENTFTLSIMKPPSSPNDPSAEDFVEFFKLEDRMLQPRDILTVWVSCKPQKIGLHTSAVHFNVGEENIERLVFLLADDKISESLVPQKPYSRRKGKRQAAIESFTPGIRPSRPNRREIKNRLPRYNIPKDVRELLEKKQVPEVVLSGLTRENYASFFKTLLIMEEIQLEEDMRAYDMEGVSMKKRGYNFLSLEVPGLAERRPSLVYGDYILAKMSNENVSYQGYIHRVEADEVHVKFDKEFHLSHSDRNSYDVQFTYNRINMRRMYQAIEAVESLDREFLFPSDRRRKIRTTPLLPITDNLNGEQILSVEKILSCKGAPPYVIHGPPGTGKTMTLVEAILQLFKTQKHARMLVCAPSNSAADHVLEKIISEKAFKIPDAEIFRLNAAARPFEEVKEDHLRFCCFDDGLFKCPPADVLLRRRVVISTYMSTSLLYAEGINRGHFSHIFLDEAGQASEPETMIPISNLCLRKTVVVLAGDPMQLGPVIYSKEAESYGMGKSYLERLFEFKYYGSSGDENYITKLVSNYRCHPAILHLPSTLFYDGELLACKDESSLTTDADILELLPNREFPVLFYGIQGCDEREGNNPSWFNRIEVSKVVEIIKKLLSSKNVGEEDIGVITPYRQQVLKIKKILESMDMLDMKIGSVEQFQGRERKIIIVSTVRSTVKHNEFDRNHCLGFLSNPRRFNVAITRAISLLVIVGNPHIICQDPHWNKLLWYCVDNDSYQGCSLPERQEPLYDDHQQYEYNNDETGQQYEDGEPWGTEQDENWNYSQGTRPGFEDVTAYGEPSEREFPKPGKEEDEWSDGWK